MSTPLNFPTSTSDAPSSDFTAINTDMRIDIPRSRDDYAANPRRQTSSNTHGSRDDRQPSQPGSAYNPHPRQPGPHSESYFSGAAAQPKTPGGSATGVGMRSHSRNLSSTGNPAPGSAVPMTIHLGDPSHHGAEGGAQSAYGIGGGPPSPSTLTDNILGMHSTLYGGKRKPEELREMVWRYYERGAVFESPLLSAHGRDQIANQFMLAFALPGIEVRSELRDVICSDFEFDGTRAGIIDHTITVTFLPSLFGSSEPAHPNSAASDVDRTPRGYAGASAHPPFSAVPVTPHPFADYGSHSAHPLRPAGTASQSHPHSPTTPFSQGSMWASSRPHTPGYPTSSSVRPLSGVLPLATTHTPPSVNDEDCAVQPSSAVPGASHYFDASAADGEAWPRPSIPADALQPHWSADGFGRRSFHGLLWRLIHPRAALKSLCSIQLRIMSRLEFNDAGLIVRHEDTWGLRETIEGIIPFASLLYAIERRVIGLLVSWAIGKGLRLSSVLLNKAINGPFSSLPPSQFEAARREQDHPQAHEAAKALLDRSVPAYARQPRDFYTISRSRAPSPSRFRFGSLSGSNSGTVTGTRSRARSLVGQQGTPSTRAASSDNLVHHFGTQTVSSSSGFVDGGSGGGSYRRSMELPPDSGAKFRERSAKRLEGGGGRGASTNSAPPTTCDPSDYGTTSNLISMWEPYSNHSSQAGSVAEDRTPSRAPDQDQQ
ncbi:hypothetical protein ACQY0O_007764 [Thecaphora frezii]